MFGKLIFMDPTYEIIDGIKCYAPEMAFDNNSFPSDSFQSLFALEDENFWFRSRNRVLKHLLEKYVGSARPQRILEIGCGTGYVLKALSDFRNFHLIGGEICLDGLRYARRRLPEVEFVQFDATRIPYYQEFDAVGAFDVLEHIEEDEKVMLGVHKALKNHGFFLISVPQYRWMWSIEDVRDCHKRRYTRKELVNKLASTNFQVLYVGLFVFMLFPLMLILRLIKRWRKTVQPSNKVALELDLPLILNRVFEFLMRIDEFLIKRGFSLPFGGSVIAVARKGSLVGTRT